MQVNLSIREDGERKEVFPLLAKCFPEYWALKVARGEACFSFPVISVIAECDNTVSGHCGILVFEFYLNGQWHKAAGLCAVAVDPECRGMGIAGKMCDEVLEYCRSKEIFFSPLYTGVPKVYEKRGWQLYDLPRPQKIFCKQLQTKADHVFNGPELNEQQKSRIRDLYLKGFAFDGKVKRSDLKWNSLLPGKSQYWYLDEDSYALMFKDHDSYILVEANATEAYRKTLLDELLTVAEGELLLHLPPGHPLLSQAAANYDLTDSDADLWHDEVAMTNIVSTEPAETSGLKTVLEQNALFFPLPDKF